MMALWPASASSTADYLWEIGHAPLSEVANVEKFMPADFISADGYGITDKCREYLYPLIQGEDYPPYENGFPRFVTLKNAPVARRLGAFDL